MSDDLTDRLRTCDAALAGQAATNAELLRRLAAAETAAAALLDIMREAARALEGGADRTEIQSALYDAVRRVEEGVSHVRCASPDRE